MKPFFYLFTHARERAVFNDTKSRHLRLRFEKGDIWESETMQGNGDLVCVGNKMQASGQEWGEPASCMCVASYGPGGGFGEKGDFGGGSYDESKKSRHLLLI